jgi:hypothetical protein
VVESDVSLDEFCELDGIACTGSIDEGRGGGLKKSRFLLVLFLEYGHGGVRGTWTNLTLQSRPLEGED